MYWVNGYGLSPLINVLPPHPLRQNGITQDNMQIVPSEIVIITLIHHLNLIVEKKLKEKGGDIAIGMLAVCNNEHERDRKAHRSSPTEIYRSGGGPCGAWH